MTWYPKQMYDCSSYLDGWQPGGRAWTISQGSIQRLSLLPLLLFPLSRTLECHHQSKECHAWLPLRRISNPTPCTGWQRCFKNNQHSFPKSQIFYYCMDLILQFKPQYSWAIQWKLLWFSHLHCCILFLKFDMLKDEKLIFSKFLDTLVVNLQKEITLKKHT